MIRVTFDLMHDRQTGTYFYVRRQQPVQHRQCPANKEPESLCDKSNAVFPLECFEFFLFGFVLRCEIRDDLHDLDKEEG